MPEDKEVSQEKEKSANETADELNSAYEEIMGEKEEKPIEKPTEKVEPSEEHKERSQLGRRVSTIERSMKEGFDEVLRRLDTVTPKREEYEETPPDVISTPQDVEKVLDIRERKKQEAYGKYQNSYGGYFRKIGMEDDADLYPEVYKEMFENFNVIRTGRPDIDAELNYAKAKVAILAKRTANPKSKPNVKGEKTAPTSLSMETRETETSSAEVPLDDFSKDFLRAAGKDTKWAREALK